MIRCPTCGLEWSPGTLTCPKDGTRLFERSSARSPVDTTLAEDPGGDTARQQRQPTPLEGAPLGAGEVAPTMYDPSLAPPRPSPFPAAPMLNPPSELRSGPKRQLGFGSLPPAPELKPEPKSGGKLVPGAAAQLVGNRPTGVAPRPGAANFAGMVTEDDRTRTTTAHVAGGNVALAEPQQADRARSNPPRPAAAAPVQPLPVARGEAARNPWGNEGSGSGTDTLKRQHETPKTQLVPPADPADPLIGIKLGEYNVIGKLGSGGMGIVYRGEQPLIGKQVAIKVLRPELASDPRQVQRLVDEARAVNAVNHPGLINIFSFGETPDGAKYFVMDLLEGQSLEELLHTRGRLKAWEAVPILEGALAALDAAHGAGVIHRDLKPSNIFLVDLPDHTHLVKLLDFGLAKMGAARGSTPQTMNVVVGTPEYMAPEQARALEVSPRTDLYAMGIVAYELLTGDVPFTCESAVETLMMQLDVVPKPAGELEPSIPEQLERLVMRMLAKRPEDRPSSAAEVKRELGRIKRQLTTAETQIAQAASLGLAPPPAAPEPKPSAPKPAPPKSLPPGTKRFETTDVMSPVTNLELRPATDRMEAPTGRMRKTVVPWLIGAAIPVLAVLAWLLFFREPAVSGATVVPPPPPKTKPKSFDAPRTTPKIEPVPAVEPPATVDPEPPPGKVEAPGKIEPTPPPKKNPEPARPKPPPVKPRPQHTKEEVLRYIDGLVAKTPQDQRARLFSLKSLKDQLQKDEKTAETTWQDLEPLDPGRK